MRSVRSGGALVFAVPAARTYLYWDTQWVENGCREGEDRDGEGNGTVMVGRSRSRSGLSSAAALLIKTLRKATAELKRHCDVLMVGWQVADVPGQEDFRQCAGGTRAFGLELERGKLLCSTPLSPGILDQ